MSKEQIAESISNIELAKLKPFRDHPFSIRDDDAMQQTVESVRAYGVLVPAIARPLEDGSYELISGHRRKHACELAGLSTMPVIIRDIDRDAATIIMVDSNLQRDSILPSERAKAYKMKLDAIKRQGARHDLCLIYEEHTIHCLVNLCFGFWCCLSNILPKEATPICFHQFCFAENTSFVQNP